MNSILKLHKHILLWLFISLSANLFAQAPVIFSIENTNGESEVEVPITVTNFDEITGFQLGLSFDKENLEFIDIQSGILPIESVNYNVLEDDKILISYVTDNAAPISLTDGGTIFKLKFKVLKIIQTEIYYDDQVLAKEMINATGLIDFEIFSGFVNDNGSGVSFSVFFDEDKDCATPSAQPLVGWPVIIWDGFREWFRFTDENGFVKAALSPGDYAIAPITLDNRTYWDECASPTTFKVEDGINTLVDDFQIQLKEDCPVLDFDMSVNRLRRCFDNDVYVKFCNQGNTLDDAALEITLDPELIMVSADLVYQDLGDNKYRFDFGTLSPGQCMKFKYVVNVDCDITDLGQTLCIAAEKFPTIDCGSTANYSGPSLKITGECNADNVNFIIENVGNENMTIPAGYTIIEDDLIMPKLSKEVQIDAGGSETITIPSEGRTVRLEIPQIPNHPFPGVLNAFIEKCGEGQNGEVSYGFATMFSNDPIDPDLFRLCEEVIGSWDPNDKAASPKGFKDPHYLKANTPIDYKIRFQNTGTDTAFNIVVRDSITENMDLATLKTGSSSHDYTFQIINQNIIEFRFDNIMLPDSNVNEPASNGFVNFSLDQVEDLPDGTVIYNQAEIYFDFNEPIITNEVFHTIGEEFVPVSIASANTYNELQVQVNPNPFKNRAYITFVAEGFKKASLTLYDLQGKPIDKIESHDRYFQLNGSALTNGMYFYKIHIDGHLKDTGKLIRH